MNHLLNQNQILIFYLVLGSLHHIIFDTLLFNLKLILQIKDKKSDNHYYYRIIMQINNWF